MGKRSKEEGEWRGERRQGYKMKTKGLYERKRGKGNTKPMEKGDKQEEGRLEDKGKMK